MKVGSLTLARASVSGHKLPMGSGSYWLGNQALRKMARLTYLIDPVRIAIKALEARTQGELDCCDQFARS
jgi:hypothetical protein